MRFVKIKHGLLAVMIVAGFNVAFVATANDETSAEKDKKYNMLKEKFQLDSGESKRTSQHLYNKLKEKNFLKNQPVDNPNLGNEMVEKHLVDREASDPNEALSNVQAIDFNANYQESIIKAKQIANKRNRGEFDPDTNTVKADYYQNGVNKLTRNEDGELIFVEKTAEERGELMDDGIDASQIVSSEMNHDDQQAGAGAEFKADDAAGSDIKVRGSVISSIGYLRNSSDGTGLMAVDAFKAVVRGSEENQMNIDQDDPLFNVAYTAISQADEDFYGDCEEHVEIIQIEETFPRTSEHQCGIAVSMGPSFCEVRREVIDQQPMTFFTASYDDNQEWSTAINNIKGNKHSGTFESGHWDMKTDDFSELVSLGGAIAKRTTDSNADTGIYTEELGIGVGLTRAFGNTSKLGKNYNSSASLNILYDFSMSSETISTKLVLGSTGSILGNNTTNGALADDEVEVVFVLSTTDITSQINVDDFEEGRGIYEDIAANEDGTYTYITVNIGDRGAEEEARCEEEHGRDSQVDCSEDPDPYVISADSQLLLAYQIDNNQRELDITEHFNTYIASKATTFELTIEIYSDLEREEFRTQHKVNQTGFRRQVGPYGDDRDESWYSSTVDTNTPPVVTLITQQPEFIVTTITAYYPEGCFEKTQNENAACSFDGTWNILEEGTRGYNTYILDNMLPLFDGDTGYKTWVAEANNYSCGPFSGGSVVVDGVSYNWDDVVANNEGCDQYESDIQCTMIESECEFTNPEDPEMCVLESRLYQCEDSYTVTREITQITNTCDMDIPCTDGNCETSAPEVNDSFDEAMMQISIAQSMQDSRACSNEADPDSCIIFGGEARQCRYEKTFSLGNDCCEVPEGTNPIEFVRATWDMSKASGLNDYVYDATASSWEAATNVLSDTSVGQSVSSAWSTTSTALTNVYDSIAGNVTREVGTDAGNQALTEATEAGVLEGMKSKTYEAVYNSLPEDLANMIFDGEQVAQSGEYVLSEASTEVLSYVEFIADAYSYYTYFKLALNLLTQCNTNTDSPEYDADMGPLIGNKQCSYVKRTSFPGNLLLKRQLHCCFDSPLARIVMEQAYPQMGYSTKEDYFEAGCPGMTPAQMSQLDWELIDLSEWLGLMHESGILPTETNEEDLTGDGRLLNQGNRQTATERTLERLNSNDAILERQKQMKRDVKPQNVDCSITPRPVICDYSPNGKLDSGEGGN